MLPSKMVNFWLYQKYYRKCFEDVLLHDNICLHIEKSHNYLHTKIETFLSYFIETCFIAITTEYYFGLLTSLILYIINFLFIEAMLDFH